MSIGGELNTTKTTMKETSNSRTQLFTPAVKVLPYTKFLPPKLRSEVTKQVADIRSS